jgi:hypothetical protein
MASELLLDADPRLRWLRGRVCSAFGVEKLAGLGPDAAQLATRFLDGGARCTARRSRPACVRTGTETVSASPLPRPADPRCASLVFAFDVERQAHGSHGTIGWVCRARPRQYSLPRAAAGRREGRGGQRGVVSPTGAGPLAAPAGASMTSRRSRRSSRAARASPHPVSGGRPLRRTPPAACLLACTCPAARRRGVQGADE